MRVDGLIKNTKNALKNKNKTKQQKTRQETIHADVGFKFWYAKKKTVRKYHIWGREVMKQLLGIAF